MIFAAASRSSFSQQLLAGLFSLTWQGMLKRCNGEVLLLPVLLPPRTDAAPAAAAADGQTLSVP